MTPAIGQRWKHTNIAHGTPIFIAEVVAEVRGEYRMHILQNIKGESQDYASPLQTNGNWIWEYLPGQDKER